MNKEVSSSTSADDRDVSSPAILWLYPELKAMEPSQRRERLRLASERSWGHWSSRVLLALVCVGVIAKMWVLIEGGAPVPVLGYTGVLTFALLLGVYLRIRGCLRTKSV